MSKKLFCYKSLFAYKTRMVYKCSVMAVVEIMIQNAKSTLRKKCPH